MKSFARLATCLSLCSVALLTLSTGSPADTIQLTGVGGTSAGGVYTGLYSLTQNGKPVLAFCDDFDTHTYIGDTWAANAYTLSDLALLKFNGADDPGALSSNTLKDYQALIYLGQLLENTPASDPQRINDLSFAIWGIFSADARANGAYDAASLAFDNTALGINYAPGQYANYVIWTPNPTSSSQEFIAPQAPEPSALLLFGSGLLGLSFFVRRFKQKLATR
jgi:hypothetical protein